MSRPYRLGKRAINLGETRRRIVEGAADAYAERGVQATSMQEVARRADVAPATATDEAHRACRRLEGLHNSANVSSATKVM
jgi:hypothetical protein